MSTEQNVTILYVDDEETNLFLFKTSFERKYSVFTASSGSRGLEKLDNHKDEIIAVISDMRMPLMNGLEFIKKAKEKYDDIAYFILSAYDHNAEIDEAIKNNIVRNYFTKPLELSEVESAITEYMEERA